MLNAIQGYKIPFTQVPPPTQLPQFAFDQEEAEAISKEIQSLSEKGAI